MMRNYFIFTLFGLAAFFAISFLLIFILAAPSINESEKEEQSPPTEQPSEDEESGDDGDNQDADSGEEGNNKEDANEDEENNKEDSGSNEEEGNGEDANNEEESSQEYYWGVDSASYTNENVYSCVVDNFGEPEVWGRYLGDREGVSAGMDSEEVNYLHENDIPILVIYNHVNEAVGYDHGVDHGNQAISMAEELGIPEGVVLFVDIEPEYPVDSAFMEGWYDTLTDSSYYPAVYGVFDEGSALLEAYNAMDQEVQENTIVWTAFPQQEPTSKDNAPEYDPQGPENSMLYGWQYAIDAETCNIDTNLFTNEMMDYLWRE
ncbi:glycoside hydrolase domain-containing protein [Oceanobacillus salinisoli]|uniref:glycoside hydrolase domain-containing protein n=1 Tax=Oceanobacillus salinisoli TaxID=2678611 RepID=UPI001E46B45F|nr:glycoside hydrolase domain-containing protein [Oceanobacillus salinisoli]